MSAFSPDIPPIPRPAPAELLARFVPSALRRTPPVAKIWRVPKLMIIGVATAGFAPAFALISRTRRVVMMHAQQCQLATRLIVGCVPPDDAKILQSAADRVGVGDAGLLLGLIAMFSALIAGLVWFGAATQLNATWVDFWFRLPAPGDAFRWLSLGWLAAGYLAVVVHVNRQLLAMQQFALAFNAVAGDRLGPIDPPPLVWGLRLKHCIAAAVMAYIGMLWAVPMMLTWAAFQTFVQDAAYRFRVRLAERVQTLGGIESVVPTIDLCPNRDCRAGLPGGAAFCPRCGTPLPAAAP